MKRSAFIGATGAAVLTGCGHGMQSLPHLSPSRAAKPGNIPVEFVPALADPIPSNVLGNPIIGEAWRFEGASAPSGWILAQGQSLPIASYKQLFSVLGHAPGEKSTTTFTVPKPQCGMIVAVSGTYMTSPQQLARSGRDFSVRAGLGKGVQLPPAPMPKRPSAEQRAAQELIANQPRHTEAHPVPVSSEMRGRIDNARSAARVDALARLDSATRASLDAAIGAAVEGRGSVYDAVVRMQRQLSTREAEALLQINDSMNRSFSAQPAADRSDPVLEAAYFLVSIAITPEQGQAIAAHDTGD